MKKNKIVLILFYCLVFSIHAEEWKTVKEIEIDTEYISIKENDLGQCILMASSSYIDGTLFFYCYAGKKDKDNLLNVFDNVELNLTTNYEIRVVSLASENINNLRYSGVLRLVNFVTDPPVYSDGYITQKTHLYCDSWNNKPY